MAIRAVVFDIGGVLEVTPDLGTAERWAAQLGLDPAEFGRRLADVWEAGAVGSITEDEVRAAIAERLALDRPTLAALMSDLWREYLGTANVELIEYARGLRPAYRTGILSNSFVGAREREQAAYGFEDLVDDIVYSHEVGFCKPDRRAYALCCARLGVSPQQTVLLDDMDFAVTGAREAGLHAVRYQDNPQAIAELRRLLAAG